jgi:hypothetical protein
MALEGSLKDFGLADILQLIYFQKKTGALNLESIDDKVRLLFIDGNITGAESKKRMEKYRVGTILLKKGYITQDDLKTVLEERKRTKSKIGHILLSKKMVKQEVMLEILQHQAAETVYQVFDWKQGTYKFLAQGIPPDKDFPFSLDTQHLLMEGMRILDEWSLLQGKLSLDTIFSRKGEAPSGLSPEETEVIKYVDGENDVSTIIDLSAKDSATVSGTLISLKDKGFIKELKAEPVIEKPVVQKEKKPSVILAFLPVFAIIVSVVISFSSLFLKKEPLTSSFEAANMIKRLRYRIDTYQINNATYPTSLKIISDQKDPWGNPYIYRVNQDFYSLVSSGPDGREGTADDVH